MSNNGGRKTRGRKGKNQAGICIDLSDPEFEPSKRSSSEHEVVTRIKPSKRGMVTQRNPSKHGMVTQINPSKHGMVTRRKSKAQQEKAKCEYVRKVVTKTQVHRSTSPAPGPSGLNFASTPIVVETMGSMLICKYKLPADYVFKTNKTYEIKWGDKYLATFSSMFKKEQSIMKKSLNNTKPKPRAKFSNATVYYFDKPSKTSKTVTDHDINLGMDLKHFHSKVTSVDAYEEEKEHRRRRRALKAEEKKPFRMILPTNNKKETLHSTEVPSKLAEEKITKKKEMPVVTECTCYLLDDPDICVCNFLKRESQVFNGDYPCGRQQGCCKNIKRNADQYNYLKNVIHVGCGGSSPQNAAGRVSKRTHRVPARYMMY